MQHVQRGEVDIMLAGASDAAVIPVGIAGYTACKALSKRNDDPPAASRPWDKNRDGFVMGEGAGVLVLVRTHCHSHPRVSEGRQGSCAWQLLVRPPCVVKGASGIRGCSEPTHFTPPGVCVCVRDLSSLAASGRSAI
jgi:hypothetical protein